jgi:hypothetical protein
MLSFPEGQRHDSVCKRLFSLAWQLMQANLNKALLPLLLRCCPYLGR